MPPPLPLSPHKVGPLHRTNSSKFDSDHFRENESVSGVCPLTFCVSVPGVLDFKKRYVPIRKLMYMLTDLR